MDPFDLSEFVVTNLDIPEPMTPPKQLAVEDFDYENYISATSNEYSVIYNKKEQNLHIANLNNKKVVKYEKIPIESLGFVDNRLIIFSNQEFYVSDIRDCYQSISSLKATSYKTEFRTVESICSIESMPDYMFYLVAEKHTIYKQKISPFEEPEVVIDDIGMLSPTKRGFLVSKLDGIYLYELDEDNLNEIFSAPIVDPKCLCGGDQTHAVITGNKLYGFNNTGDIVYESSDSPLNAYYNSPILIYQNNVSFLDPYVGEVRIKAISGAIIQKSVYCWDHNLEIKQQTMPNPKIDVKLLPQEAPKANTQEPPKEKPKQNKSDKKSQQSKESPQKQTPKNDNKPNKKDKKDSKDKSDKKSLTKVNGHFVNLRIKSPGAKISKQEFERCILAGDQPQMLQPCPPLNVSFAAIYSIHTDKDIISKITSTIKNSSAEVVPDEMHNKGYYIISSPHTPITDKTIDILASSFDLTVYQSKNVFCFDPYNSDQFAKLSFSYLNKLVISNYSIRLYESVDQVPVVFVSNLPSKGKREDIIAKIFEEMRDGIEDVVACGKDMSVVFKDVQIAKNAAEKNFMKFEDVKLHIVRFTEPFWRENTKIQVVVSGDIPEDELYTALHANNKKVIHVFRRKENNVVVYSDRNAAQNGEKEFSQGKRVNGKLITIIRQKQNKN